MLQQFILHGMIIIPNLIIIPVLIPQGNFLFMDFMQEINFFGYTHPLIVANLIIRNVHPHTSKLLFLSGSLFGFILRIIHDSKHNHPPQVIQKKRDFRKSHRHCVGKFR